MAMLLVILLPLIASPEQEAEVKSNRANKPEFRGSRPVGRRSDNRGRSGGRGGDFRRGRDSYRGRRDNRE